MLSGLYTQQFKDLYTEAEDETYRAFKKNCVIHYPAVKTDCTDCTADPIGDIPGNFFFDGTAGHNFTTPGCPYCSGTGFKETRVTGALNMQVNFDQRRFNPNFRNIAVANPTDIFVQTKMRLEDWPKARKAEFVTLDYDLHGTMRLEATLDGAGIPNGILQNKYVLALFRRM